MIRYKGISTLEILEGANNYNKWIFENFTSLLEPPILEIGSGTGNISSYFVSKTPLFLTDLDKGLVKYLKNKFKGKKGVFVSHLDLEKNLPKKLQGKFKTVIGINVFEHIKEDNNAFTNSYKLLKKNGKLLLLLPAKKLAFTKLDKNLGHYRRYEKKEVISKLEAAGFKINKIYFFNMVGFFSWILRDKLERAHEFKPYQVMLFDKIVPLLRIIEKIQKPPLGVSLIVVAQKV